MNRRYALPLIGAALLAGAVEITAMASTPNAGASVHRHGCTDQVTREYVRPGDAVRNYGHDWVCRSDGKLVVIGLPRGFWWRTIRHQVGDCGHVRNITQHPIVIIGYGPGDLQSGLYCPPRPWGNGSVNPS